MIGGKKPRGLIGRRKCPNCHHDKPASEFKKSLYCRRCQEGMREAVEQGVENRLAIGQGNLIDGMISSIERMDPLTPQLVEKVLERYGGLDQFAESLHITIAMLEGRWFDGKVVTFAEAERRGGIKQASGQLLFKYHKLLADVLELVDEQRAGSSQFEGMTAQGMLAAMRGGMLDQMKRDPVFRRDVMAMIKRRPEWMVEFNEVSAILPTTATTVQPGASS